MNTVPLLEAEPLSPEANHRIFTALAREMTRYAPAVDRGELVEDATISYLQPDEPTRRNRRKGLLLGLIAVAAAVLGFGIMARDNSARTRTGTDVTPETMPIYLPTSLPEGFTFSYGDDFTNGPDGTPPFRNTVYRDLSKPIGARALQITTSLALTGVRSWPPDRHSRSTSIRRKRRGLARHCTNRRPGLDSCCGSRGAVLGNRTDRWVGQGCLVESSWRSSRGFATRWTDACS